MFNAVRRFVSGLILLALPMAAVAGTPDNIRRPVPRNTIGKSGSGIYRGHRVHYLIVSGRMMMDGDIVLEHVDQILPGKNYHPGGTLDYRQYLWTKVGGIFEIPYMIDPASGDTTNINTAISTYNTLLSGVIQWVPYTNQTDYVDFDLTDSSGSGEGFSNIGRSGGKQIIGGATNCTVSTILHEMGHATGFWHEQSRPDRDNYLTMNFDNMVTTVYSDSEIQYDDMQALTLYDWSSVMQYFPLTFSKVGNVTMESIPAGMPLSNTVGYSAGDIDAIKRLYLAAPAEVTITTNPPGLQVIVDGSTVTTPQTYSWTLNSTHTLSVATGVQTLTGDIAGTTTSTTFYYNYGRWNDNGAQTHTITVLPGNNEVAFPATSPAVTVYEASFIQLVPYQASVAPPGAGTVTPNPAPQSYSGSALMFYTARQSVTITATPSTGQNFYQYINSPYWLPGGLSLNPKPFLVPDSGNPINTIAYFTPTTSPIFTFDSNPDGPSNFYVILDGGYWPAPISFSPYYDTSWNPGTNHTIAVPNPEYPWTLNTRYAFQSWSDGGAVSHGITMPSTSTTYLATLQPQYFLSDYAKEPCAGSIAVTQPSPTGDSYYPGDSPLTFTATVNSGWTFTQWEQNLSGTANPLNVVMNDELTGIADFSTISTPLTVTSISPSAAVANGGPFTMTINGTGFTNGANPTEVWVNNSFVANTFVNPNQITVVVPPTALTTPGGIQVFVENFPSGATCAAYGALPFNVASAPIVTPTPLSVSFAPQFVNTTSAAKSVTLKNTSASSVNINSIAATGNFAITSNNCGSSLGSGKICMVQLTFTPTVGGAISGALAISDTAPDSPQIVNLKGTGNLPVSISPPTLNFGTVSVGTTSAAKTVSVTNNESSTLSFSYAPSGNYAISSTGTTCTGSLASKAKCNLAVTFSPTANGAVNGAVSLTDSSSFSPQLVSLSGTGSGAGAAPLTFTPPTTSFPNTLVGTTSAPKTVTVKNASASAVTVSSIAASGYYAATGTGATPCAGGLDLAAGASCTMSVTFSPALGAGGGISGSVVIADNGAIGEQVYDVKGIAALPLSFTPASLSFAAQTVATTSAAQTVTLTNNLATSLSPAIAGYGEFAVVSGGATPCTGALAAHAKCTFTVTFTPSAVGTRSTAITVTDAASPSVETMNVSGTGQ